MGAPFVQVGVNCWKIGVWLSLSDVVRSCWLIQTPIHCIPHPYHMYSKCYSAVIYCEWAYGYECTFTLIWLCRCGWFFGKAGLAELEWCCNVMFDGPSPAHTTLHPTSISYVNTVQLKWLTPHKYTKRFDTLIFVEFSHANVVARNLHFSVDFQRTHQLDSSCQ